MKDQNVIKKIDNLIPEADIELKNKVYYRLLKLFGIQLKDEDYFYKKVNDEIIKKIISI